MLWRLRSRKLLVLAARLEIENRSLFDSGGPTRRQCLHPGVEPDPFRAMHIVITKSERFQPPKLWKASGTGIGTLTPTMPIRALAKIPRVSPSLVNIAVPFPYS